MDNEKNLKGSEEVLKKVSMLGDLSVGKTSMVNRYVFNIFGDEYISTIGTKVAKKQLICNNLRVILMIWDIAGETTFNHIRKAYFRGAEAGLMVVDITRKETLDNATDWISSFKEITDNAPVLILVNKTDLKDDYSFSMDDANELATRYDSKALFTSAKTGTNVEEAFYKITELIFTKSTKPETG